MAFGCDDVVFVAPVNLRLVSDGLKRLGLIGVSLRLGLNVKRDMFGVSLPQPQFLSRTDWPVWDVTHPHSLGDWAYPWEVLGTVYPTAYVQAMLGAFEFSNPNQLEERGSRHWSEHTDNRLMAAWPTSRIVVPTVNIVQTEFPGNGIRGPRALEPAFLLECWNSGLRLDPSRLQGLEPESWRVPDFYLRRAA